MDCLKPITLKSGLTVPCGKCLCCLSARRAELSLRLQIHCMYYDRQPLMITLTYDDKHLLYGNDKTLYRPHVSSFLKSYKRKNQLRNETFTYFGCGEYGDRFDRPHYHLLFFGDNRLDKLFWQDSRKAEEFLEKFWCDENGVKRGNVWIGLAQVSGIHYICKYVLKDGLSEKFDQEPYAIFSKGLGATFFRSERYRQIKRQLDKFMLCCNMINDGCPAFDISDKDSLLAAKEYYQQFVPDWSIVLDNGRVVKLPRYFRKKMIGTFQNWYDNPFWKYNLIDRYLRSYELTVENADRLEIAMAAQSSKPIAHAQKIQDNLYKRMSKKLNYAGF